MTANHRGIGMTSQRTRDRLVNRLRDEGIKNPAVLQAVRRQLGQSLLEIPKSIGQLEELEIYLNQHVVNPVLSWSVTSTNTLNATMDYPTTPIEINESEANNNYTQTCNASCDLGGVDCENVTLFVEYNPSVYSFVNTTTIDLINDEDNHTCPDLIAGGDECVHTFLF